MDKTNNSFDLVIVGGGIIGLYTACQVIVRHPLARVCILERETIASGTTGLSLALCSPINESERIEKMYRFSRFFYEKYSSSYGLPLYYKPVYSVTSTPEEQRCTFGVDIQQVNAAKSTFSSKIPMLTLKDIDTLLYRGNALFFEMPELIDWLRNFLQSRGVVLFEGEEVMEMTSSEKDVAIATDKKVLIAKKVVVSIGKHIRDNEIGNMTNTRSLNKKIVAFKHPLIQGLENLPVISFPDEKAFLIQKADGVYLSLTSEEWNTKKDELNAVDAKLLNDFLKLRLNLKPEDFEGIVGTDNYKHDKVPSINFTNDHENVVVIEGASGRGVKLGPYIAHASLQLLNLTKS